MGRHRQTGPPRRSRSVIVYPLVLLLALGVGAVTWQSPVAGLASGFFAPDPAPNVAVSPETTPTAAATPEPTPTTTPDRPTADTTTSATRSGISCTYPAGATATVRTLQDRLAEAVASTPTRLAVTVYDWQTGSWCDFRGSTRFEAASVIKATTVATLLWQAENQDREPSSTELAWAEDAITVSDNDAETALWESVGGASGVQSFLTAAGMKDTRPGADGFWGLSQVTADDQVRLLQQLAHSGVLNEDHRHQELSLMRQVTLSQRWGVPTNAPEGSNVAVKNGWLSGTDGWHVNTIGYISGDECEYAVAVLSDRSTTMEMGIASVETVAQAVHTTLV
ncbi:MAG: serine hydrolase [Kineosporiaceae bacterium]|jgi:beta-lactamase class A